MIKFETSLGYSGRKTFSPILQAGGLYHRPKTSRVAEFILNFPLCSTNITLAKRFPKKKKRQEEKGSVQVNPNGPWEPAFHN